MLWSFRRAPKNNGALVAKKSWRSSRKVVTSLIVGILTIAGGIGSLLMPEAHAYTADAFVMVVKTDNPGTSSATSFTIPITGAGYSYNVDCNDDGTNEVTARTTSYTCTYGAAGTYTIAITGTFPRIYFNNGGDRQKLLEVKQWGNIAWTSMASAFYGCINMHITAVDAPNLTGVTNMSGMFHDATSMNENINSWDVSHVTNMSSLFYGQWYNGTDWIASSFNQPLNNWNTSAVTNMSYMFYWATTFNQDISGWNVSSVTNMSNMFYMASAFNQDISGWNVSSVTNMSYMFEFATAFNQPVGNWDTSKVTNMSGMFYYASVFNQPLASWNTSAVTNMAAMFALADAFNQPIGNWDTSKVTDMAMMFFTAPAFNQPVGNWNTSKVTNMRMMFANAMAFNQPITSWDTAAVTNMSNMFMGAEAFNQPIGGWNTAAVTNMSWMFMNAHSFNQPIGGWNTAAVTNMSWMFGETAFNQDIGGWDVSRVTDMSNMFRGAFSFNQPIGSWNVGAVTNMSCMFERAATFNQPLGAWDVSKVIDMTSMFDNSNYPRSIYDQTLAGWATQTLQPNVPLGATGVCYLDTTARNTLTSAPNNWVITDSGECKPSITSPINGVVINDTYQPAAITGVTRASSAIRVSIDGTDYASTSQPDGSFSYQVPTELANGSHTLTVSLLDGLNNVISTSSPVNFTIQYSPTVISTPTNQAVVNADKPSINGTTLPNHALTIVIDGNQYASTSKSDGSFNFQVPVSLASGWRTAEVRLLNMNSDTLSTTQVKFYVHTGGNVAFSGAAVAPTLTWPAVPRIPAGTLWQQTAADATSFPVRGGFGTAVLNGKLWVVGGQGASSRLNDVWSSPDGVTWTQELANAPWTARNSHTLTAFNGKLWLMGGRANSGYLNEIWSSPDGITWTQETASASWLPRSGHQVIQHDGKLWLMGGVRSGGGFQDVWNSTDGINWTLVTDTAAWSNRNGFGAASFNNKLWVMGGANEGVSPFTNDVWSSTDGITWTEETAGAAWPIRASLQVEVFDGKMWVLGGSAAGWDSEYSDVWFSENGKDWIRTTEAADWQARRGHSSVVFNDKLWVLGGRVGSSWTLSNDVWSATLPEVTYTICWDTVENGCAQTAQTTNSSFTIPSNLAKGTWHFKVTANIPGTQGIGSYTTAAYTVTDPLPVITPLTGKPVIHPVTGAASTVTLAPTLAEASLSVSSYDCSDVKAPTVRLVEPDGLKVPEANVTLLGGVGFSVGCTSNGKSADVSLALGTSYRDTSKLRAYKQTGAVLTDITNQVTFTNQDTNGTTKTVASYNLVDGGELDEDGLANGTLVDPIFIGAINGAGGSLANTGFNIYLLFALAAALLTSAAAIWRKSVKVPKRVSFR